jgi:hypothetical protein
MDKNILIKLKEVFNVDLKEKIINGGPFTVVDIYEAEFNLEPLICTFCGSQEVTFYQYIGDAHCAECGEWQND